MNHSLSFTKKILKHLAILSLILASPLMAAEKYALLVGVSNYPNLEAHLQLEGPSFDVVLMKQLLREFRFTDKNTYVLVDVEHLATRLADIEELIYILTDIQAPELQNQIQALTQVKNNLVALTQDKANKLPTRQNILAALQRLTRHAKKNDFVFLYFSGHGSQQPAPATIQKTPKPQKTPHEPDGLDELFLPRDIGHWNDEIGAVTNAIVDDEFNHYLTALRNKGAFVWLVFDSCHSGTMTRGVQKKTIRERRVSPHALGVPSQALTASQSRGVSSPRPSDTTAEKTPLNPLFQSLERPPFAKKRSGVSDSKRNGGYVAFYAAQTSETTPEMSLPTGNLEQRSHGLFTYTLAKILAQHHGLTYREAAELILQHYAAQNYHHPTPLFEGTHLDAPIFGAQARQRIPQWPIKRQLDQLKIPAGQLHRLASGSLFAILANAAATNEAVLGYAQITQTAIWESHLKTVAYQNKPALKPKDIPSGAYARLIKPNISLSLRIALPPQLAVGTSPELETQARQVLNEIIAAKQNFGVDLTWVSADKEADLYLLLKNNQLWLLPPTTELIETGPHKTHSIRLNTADLREKLETSFQAIANVLNLLRLYHQMPQGRLTQSIQINASVTHANEQKPFEANKIPQLLDGDLLTVQIKNHSDSAVDVTILYIDSDYGITAMYPYEEGENNRIEPGGNDWLELELFAEISGIERLIVIAVEAQPNMTRRDFSFLAQPRLPRTRGKKSLYQMLLNAGFGAEVADTRSAKPQRLNQSLIKVFSWQLAPKPPMKLRGRKDRRLRKSWPMTQLPKSPNERH
jgi:hypothetical protein